MIEAEDAVSQEQAEKAPHVGYEAVEVVVVVLRESANEKLSPRFDLICESTCRLDYSPAPSLPTLHGESRNSVSFGNL